ncbi:MAG: hypothetical protein ABIP20_14985 [Chthoniobacteraceae bacterium]
MAYSSAPWIGPSALPPAKHWIALASRAISRRKAGAEFPKMAWTPSYRACVKSPGPATSWPLFSSGSFGGIYDKLLRRPE